MKNILFLFLLNFLIINQSFAQEEYCSLNQHQAITFGNTSREHLYHIEKLDNGKTMLYGESYYHSNNTFKISIARLNPDASLDTTFSNDGRVHTKFFSRSTCYYGFTDFNGKVYSMGYTATSNGISTFSGYISRFLDNGSIDSTFGNYGFMFNPFEPFRYFIGGQISQDSIITVVSTRNDGHLAILKLKYDGSMDSTYHGVGHYSFPVAHLAADYGSTEFVKAPDGGFYIVTMHYISTNAQHRPAVIKFTEEGELDTTFNDDGRMHIPIAIGKAFKNIQGHYDPVLNKLYVSASKHNNTKTLIIRINPNGTLDTNFSSDGYLWSPNANPIVSQGIITDPNTGNVIQFGSQNFKPYIFQVDTFGNIIQTCGQDVKTINNGWAYDHSYTNAYYKNDKLHLFGISSSDDTAYAPYYQSVNYMTPVDYCFLYGNEEHAMDTIICNESSFNFNGKIITNDGTYRDTLQNIIGCDSIVKLDITFEELDLDVVKNGDSLIAASGYTNYNWINCDLNVQVGVNRIFVAEDNGHFACIVSTENCTDTTDCIEIKGISVDEEKETLINYYWKNNDLVVQHSAWQTPNNIQLYNSLGQKMQVSVNKNSNQTILPLQSLASGIYTLTLQFESEFRVIKFSKW
jgi:uncharacterized delta-60 repeat protein